MVAMGMLFLLSILISVCHCDYQWPNTSSLASDIVPQLRHRRNHAGGKSEMSIFLIYGGFVAVHMPHIKSCHEFRFDAYGYDDGFAPPSNFQLWKKFHTCRWISDHRFQLSVGFNHYNFLIRFFRKYKQTSFKHLYYNSPTGYRRGRAIEWHVVGSSGPGWIDIRFKTADTIYPQILTFYLNYKRLHVNALGDSETIKTDHSLTRINSHVDYNANVARTLPPVNCPEFYSAGMHCFMLTDIVRPNPNSNERYTDYYIEVQNFRIIPLNFGPPNVHLDTERSSRKYEGVVRVWQTCDPTYNCPPYLQPIRPPKNRSEPTSKVIEDEVTEQKNYTTESPEGMIGQPGTSRRILGKEPSTLCKIMRIIWPFYLFIFLLCLFVFLPWFYHEVKRRTIEEELRKCSAGSTEDGLIEYKTYVPDVGWFPTPQKKQSRRSTRNTQRRRTTI